MMRERKLRKNAGRIARERTISSSNKGPNPEQTEILFGKYDLEEIWESARPEPTEAEVEKLQSKIL